MPLTKFKRPNGVWYVRGTVTVGDRRKSVYKSTGLTGETEAEIWRADYESRVIKGLLHGEEYIATFAEAVTSYRESGGTRRFVEPLLRHFKTVKLKSITQSDLDKAARVLYQNTGPETRNRQVYTPFIAIWNHAVGNEWAVPRKWSRPRKVKGTNVVALKKQRAGTHPVQYDHAAEFAAAMSPAPAMLMTTLFYTGMRPIELFGLDAKSVNVKGRWITLTNTKTGEPRGVPMHEFLVPLFDALVKRGGIVFRTHKGEPYASKEDGGGQLKTAIAGARKRSGIMDVSPYTGRHSASTALVVAGVHPHIKDQILGHAADDMSRHYTNVPQAPLIEAINKLPVPASWRALPWWEDPVKWAFKLHENMGHRTDLESQKTA